MKALYRKYRPKNLSEVVGQNKVTDILQNALEKNKISHAYLFTGPRGTGKTSVARIFAHEINHFDYELEDDYVDIIEIDAASNTGVDNIRELKERALIAPTKGKYKVYIIDEVHMLSKSAFNALLKILEEPPKHVVFILATTDVQKVPITITSRVQKLVFNLATKETMFAHLKMICEKEQIEITDDAIKTIVKRGGGSFRDSLSLLDQISNLSSKKITKDLVEKSLGLPQDELIISLLNQYSTGNLSDISNTIKTILNSGVKPETLAEEIINQILDEPKPELIPLLSKLPEVKAPFSDAKLLLAFANTNYQTQEKTISQTSTQQLIKKNPEKLQANISKLEHKIPTTTKLPKTFTWTEYKNSIDSKGLKLQLEKCEYRFENGVLKIYTRNSTFKKILEKPNNIEVLRKNLPETTGLEIHEISEMPKTSNDKLSIINDIMGKTQEVENDGEIPF